MFAIVPRRGTWPSSFWATGLKVSDPLAQLEFRNRLKWLMVEGNFSFPVCGICIFTLAATTARSDFYLPQASQAPATWAEMWRSLRNRAVGLNPENWQGRVSFLQA